MLAIAFEMLFLAAVCRVQVIHKIWNAYVRVCASEKMWLCAINLEYAKHQNAQRVWNELYVMMIFGFCERACACAYR